MMKNYSDFFEKPNNLTHGKYIENLYESFIPKPQSQEPYSKQFQHLFKRCFSHHIQMDTYLNKISASELKYTFKTGDSEFFEDDNISAYFMEKHYTPPALLRKKNIYDTEEDAEKTDFIAFERDVTKAAFSNPKNAGTGSLGTNLCRFLIGEIGEGKTALLAKLYRNILMQPENYIEVGENDFETKLIPIYFEIDFTQAEAPRPLEEYFFVDLYKKLYSTIWYLQGENFFDIIEDLEKYDPAKQEKLDENKAKNLIVVFIKYLAKNHLRILIIIDNIDSFHYHHARYAFFEKGLSRLNKSITSLEAMMKSFMPSVNGDNEISNAGIGVIFSMRRYVYKFITTRNPLFNRTDKDDGTLYTLVQTKNNLIINSRASLFKDALIKISKHGKLDNWHLKLYLRKIDNIIKRDKNKYYTKIIKLSHHGNRSLVDYITEWLSVDIRNHILSQRLLLDPKSIVLDIYILYGYKKYTQAKGFFPNLFLNDCMVSIPPRAPKEAHRPHMQTYLLKYFIIKYIVLNKGITFNTLLKEFEKYYDEHLVRLAVGSLCTANEFQCAEIPLKKTLHEIKKSSIIATNRGYALVEKGFLGDYPDVEFCFTFNYLQHILDDPLLSFPTPYIDNLYDGKLNYGSAYKIGYEKESIQSIKKNSQRIQNFIKLLEESLKFEIKKTPDLEIFLNEQDLIPDFYMSRLNIIDHTRYLLRQFKAEASFNAKDAAKNAEKLDFENFFNQYLGAGAPNVETI